MSLLAQDKTPPLDALRKPIPEHLLRELSTEWSGIQKSVTGLKQLEKAMGEVSGSMSLALERRKDTQLRRTLELSQAYCEHVANLHEAGYDLDGHYSNVLWLLNELPTGLESSTDRLRNRKVPIDFGKPALEQIALDRQFVDKERLYRQLNNAALEAYEVAARLGVDLQDLQEQAIRRHQEGAVNISVFLDLALTEVGNLRASLSVMPEDTELKAKLRVAELRVRETIKLLSEDIESLEEAGLPTDQYRRQLLSATGTVTTVSLDINVLYKVVQEWVMTALKYLKTYGPNFLFQSLLFILIIYVFYRLSDLVRWAINSVLNARHVTISKLMRHMIVSVARGLTILLGVFIALSQFNVSLGPMLAGLGIAGFIIGFALQDSLSNFASGLMILFYKPFDVGDTVMAAKVSGKVRSMSLVNTTIRTFDNQSLIIPNNMIWQDVITNLTDQKIRRIDMEFGITYDEDIDRVERILHIVLESDERVLKDPEPRVMVGSFGDSSVNMLCRPWVRTENYWDLRWDLNKKIKQAFDREGVVIPFPQRDVHLYSKAPAELVEDSKSKA